MNGYQVTAQIGRGGFADVFEAVQSVMGRRVAVKVLSAPATDEATARRFQSECATIGRLSWHPHVVAVHDAGFTDDGRPYLVMDLIEGGTLADVLRNNRRLPAEEVARVGTEVAGALGAAHDLGVVHRDVKPGNVLVGRQGESLLADFGIATLSDATRSTTGSFSGTIAYCAPELHRGERATALSDIYSLGSMLYALVQGTPPFMEDPSDAPSAIILRSLSDPVPDLPSTVPQGLRDAVHWAMAKSPPDRPASAAELAAALQAQASDGFSRPDPGTSASEEVTDETVRRDVGPSGDYVLQRPTVNVRPAEAGESGVHSDSNPMALSTVRRESGGAKGLGESDLSTGASAFDDELAEGGQSIGDTPDATKKAKRLALISGAAVVAVIIAGGLVANALRQDPATNATDRAAAASSGGSDSTDALTSVEGSFEGADDAVLLSDGTEILAVVATFSEDTESTALEVARRNEESGVFDRSAPLWTDEGFEGSSRARSTIGLGAAWFLDLDGDRLARVSLPDLSVIEYPIPATMGSSVRVAGDAVWILTGDQLHRFDPSVGEVAERVPLPADTWSFDLQADGQHLLLTAAENSLVRFDTATRAFGERMPVPLGRDEPDRSIFDVAVSNGVLWFTTMRFVPDPDFELSEEELAEGVESFTGIEELLVPVAVSSLARIGPAYAVGEVETSVAVDSSEFVTVRYLDPTRALVARRSTSTGEQVASVEIGFGGVVYDLLVVRDDLWLLQIDEGSRVAALTRHRLP